MAPGSPEPEIHGAEPKMGARYLPGGLKSPSPEFWTSAPRTEAQVHWGLRIRLGAACRASSPVPDGPAFLPESTGGLPPRFHLGTTGSDMKKAGVDPCRMLGLLRHRVGVSSFQKSLGGLSHA